MKEVLKGAESVGDGGVRDGVAGCVALNECAGVCVFEGVAVGTAVPDFGGGHRRLLRCNW